MPFHSTAFQAQHSPNLENLNMSIILVGHFQIANSNPQTLKNTPDIEVFVSTSGRFRSFRCLTSKSIGFRQKQANTEKPSFFFKILNLQDYFY